MVVIYHKDYKVVAIEREGESVIFSAKNISKAIFEIASYFPNELLIWCKICLKPNINFSEINDIFHHHKIMASYSLSEKVFLSDLIGYVEDSPFIKINKKVRYPTWLMSSDVGGIHASVLLVLKKDLSKSENFDYFLNSLAKLAMFKGLFCYSEPALLIDVLENDDKHKKNNFLLFRFVKQHYKIQWTFLLLANLFLYERKIVFLPFFLSLFHSKKVLSENLLESIEVQSTKRVLDNKTIDVIIPTIGRKQYLYDVLQDLAQQTHLPQKVIIVEQNPMENSVSELDYLITEVWPFEIKHIFTHQSGACNARNLALAQVTSEWVFLNDDDNRFDKNLIENVFAKSIQYGVNAITTVYLQPNQIQYFNSTHQSGIFGSGNSFVKANALAQIRFDMSLEFGYGEDTDFGCQLRNLGNDIIFFPDLKITHLKAPMGGFRIKIKKQWEDDEIQPKPSPTIMYLKRKHFTDEQINSYKLIYFIKSIKNQSFIKWYSVYKTLQKGWESSIVWSKKI